VGWVACGAGGPPARAVRPAGHSTSPGGAGGAGRARATPAQRGHRQGGDRAVRADPVNATPVRSRLARTAWAGSWFPARTQRAGLLAEIEAEMLVELDPELSEDDRSRRRCRAAPTASAQAPERPSPPGRCPPGRRRQAAQGGDHAGRAGSGGAHRWPAAVRSTHPRDGGGRPRRPWVGPMPSGVPNRARPEMAPNHRIRSAPRSSRLRSPRGGVLLAFPGQASQAGQVWLHHADSASSATSTDAVNVRSAAGCTSSSCSSRGTSSSVWISRIASGSPSVMASRR
jgi:hypothetical protein